MQGSRLSPGPHRQPDPGPRARLHGHLHGGGLGAPAAARAVVGAAPGRGPSSASPPRPGASHRARGSRRHPARSVPGRSRCPRLRPRPGRRRFGEPRTARDPLPVPGVAYEKGRDGWQRPARPDLTPPAPPRPQEGACDMAAVIAPLAEPETAGHPAFPFSDPAPPVRRACGGSSAVRSRPIRPPTAPSGACPAVPGRPPEWRAAAPRRGLRPPHRPLRHGIVPGRHSSAPR